MGIKKKSALKERKNQIISSNKAEVDLKKYNRDYSRIVEIDRLLKLK